MLQNEAVVSSVRMLSHGSAENEKVMAGQTRVIMLQNEAVSQFSLDTTKVYIRPQVGRRGSKSVVRFSAAP